MEDEFEKKVLQTICKYNLINKEDKIVIGVSGGPDSIALLQVLYNFKNSNNQRSPAVLAVAHINHMIRAEAASDEKYVETFCKEKDIQFYSKSIDVKKMANNSKIGTEEAGRIARYDFFEEVAKKVGANKIAIAHNKNDKAETVIMNLLRGSGITGLKGIEPKRDNFIRPIIECERFEIEEYCSRNNLNPRIDKTNFENIYTRNKVRNRVIPYIKKEFNPNIIQTIERLSTLIIEEDEYIAKQTKAEFNKILIDQDSKEIQLDLKMFNNQEKVIKSRIILYTITKLFGSTKGIEKVHIDDIIKLCQNNIGNKYLTPNKNTKILIKKHKIYFSKVL